MKTTKKNPIHNKVSHRASIPGKLTMHSSAAVNTDVESRDTGNIRGRHRCTREQGVRVVKVGAENLRQI